MRRGVVALAVAVIAVGIALIFLSNQDDDGPNGTSVPTSPGTPTTEAPPETDLRAMTVVSWTWDTSSITLTVTNNGNVRTAGTAACIVDFGPGQGTMAPGMPLPVLDPGATATETYRDLWAADVTPVGVSDCTVTSVG